MFRRIIIWLLLIIPFTKGYASHIVGGALSMKWNSGNSYTITLKVLRDCINANSNAIFDGQGVGGPGSGSQCVIGMFSVSTNARIMTIDMGSPTVTNLKISGPNCTDAPTQCTELGVYKITRQFSPATYNDPNGYYFTYQRCCRNKIIQNINLPADAAIAVYMKVPAFSMHNTTPDFNNNPFTYLCQDNPFTYNFKYTEPDGDELRYSVITPMNGFASSGPGGSVAYSTGQPPPSGPYPDINWLPGYSDTNEIRGAPPFSIDPVSGNITMIPAESGVFVTAIKVEEYRAGVKISEVRLELQFSITSCLGNEFPRNFYRNTNGSFSNGKFNVRIPNKLCFDILATDPNDSLFIKIGGLAFTNPAIKTKPYLDSPTTFGAFKNGITRFCWQTDCSLSGLPDQIFTLDVADNGCPIPKSIKSTFTVHIDSMINPKPIVTFEDVSGNPDTNYHAVRIPDNLCFNIKVKDPGDSIDVYFSGDLLPKLPQANRPQILPSEEQHGKDSLITNFCWQPDCSRTGISVQTINVLTKDRGCFAKIDTTPFYLKVDSMPLVNPPDLLCLTLLTNDRTLFDFGDSTLNDPYYLIHHIYRSVNGSPFELYDSLHSRELKGTYLDFNSPDNRNTDYQYYMRAENKCKFEGPPSDTSGTAENHSPVPQVQKLITVTVENNQFLRVIWPKTKEKDFARYFLYRTYNGDNNFMPVADYHIMSDTFYDDHEVDVQSKSYCYYLMMKDTCQNLSPMGPLSCSILLEGYSIPFESKMHWNPYEHWDNGVRSYSLYKEDNVTPFSKLTETSSSVLSYTDDNLNRKAGLFSYYIIANQNSASSGLGSSENELPFSRSNTIDLYQSPLLHVPNAFTPNHDGLNELWDLHDVFVKDFELKVYDRWGRMVFYSNDKNNYWNGEINGEYAQDNVYVYMISYTGWDQSLHYLKGNVTVLH